MSTTKQPSGAAWWEWAEWYAHKEPAVLVLLFASSLPAVFPRGERVGPGSVWRCRCGRRWTLSGPDHNLMWRRRFWPWPR